MSDDNWAPQIPYDHPNLKKQKAWVLWIVVILVSFTGLIVWLGVYASGHPETSFSYRCHHAHGVVAGNVCVKQDAAIPNP